MWRYTTRADMAQANNNEVAELLWDVSKAFERVNRNKLVALAKHLGYPMGVLRLSLLSYSWPRHLVDGHLIAQPIHPTMGYWRRLGFRHFRTGVLRYCGS